jgi:hypothetical protein
MELEKAKMLAQEIEFKLLAMLDDFESKSGLTVTYIDLQRQSSVNDLRDKLYDINFRLEL